MMMCFCFYCLCVVLMCLWVMMWCVWWCVENIVSVCLELRCVWLVMMLWWWILLGVARFARRFDNCGDARFVCVGLLCGVWCLVGYIIVLVLIEFIDCWWCIVVMSECDCDGYLMCFFVVAFDAFVWLFVCVFVFFSVVFCWKICLNWGKFVVCVFYCCILSVGIVVRGGRVNFFFR